MPRLLPLLLAVALLLSGCAGSTGVENRAYALILGVDSAGDGRVRLTVRVPVSGGSGGEEKEGKPSPYLTFSAEGASYADALSTLEWAVPRKLSLSHILLVALSEDLASSGRCPELIDQLMETRSLYAAARLVVCEGLAADYLAGWDTVLGARLSSEINAGLRHEASMGLIPDATLADAYYLSHSIYGDPAVAHCGAGKGDDAPAFLPLPEADDVRESPGASRCLGGVVLRSGRTALRLSPEETLCLCLLRGGVKAFELEAKGIPVTLVPERTARRVRWTDDGVALEATLALACPEPLEEVEAQRLEHELAEAVSACVGRCQAAGLDPFGFSESAVRRFLTRSDWEIARWREAYAAAPLTVEVKIRSG